MGLAYDLRPPDRTFEPFKRRDRRLAPNSFRAGGAMVAVATYAIADQETRLAPHIGQDAVQQLLRAARLDVDLMYSLWKP